MTGYNISCDPGDLYSRRCYTTNPTTGAKEEIIGYDSAGNPLSKGATTAAGTAWQINYTTLNDQGNAYQPYGAAGMPWTMSGLAGIFGVMPSGGADPQDWNYITNVAPGSYSRKMYNSRVCNPLWPTLGCRTSDPESSNTVTTAPTEANNAGSEAWYNKYFGWFNAEDTGDSPISAHKFALGAAVLVGATLLIKKSR